MITTRQTAADLRTLRSSLLAAWIVVLVILLSQTGSLQGAAPSPPAGFETEVQHVLTALIALTEGPDISAGRYTIEDTEVALTRFPLRVPLPLGTAEEGERLLLTPFVAAEFGYAEAREEFRLIPELDTNESIQKTTAYLGEVGLDVALSRTFTLTAAMAAGFSKTKSRLYGEPVVGELLGDLIDWTVEAVTLAPVLWLRHEHDFGAIHLDTFVRGVYLYSESTATTYDYLDFTSNSGLVSLGTEVTVPTGIDLFGCPLKLAPLVIGTALVGEALDALESDYLLRSGLSVFAETEKQLPLLSKIGAGGHYTFGEDVSGWSIGLVVGFHL